MSSPSVTKVRNSRASVACDACRKRKIKCSGNIPCLTCQRRSIQCTVAEDSRRIVVTERYLQSLHRRLKRYEAGNDDPAISHDADESDDTTTRRLIGEDDNNTSRAPPNILGDESNEPTEEDVWDADLTESPFPDDSSFIKDNRSKENRWCKQRATTPKLIPSDLIVSVYIAQSSSWSFVFRVTDLLQEATPEATEGLRFPLDGDAYPLSWEQVQVDDSNILQSIPPQDYAIYLLNSVKFHLSHRLRLFDPEAFAAKVLTFYSSPHDTVRSSRLWYVQFLVVLAFGKALLERARNSSSPPGFDFFARAMALLPSVPELQRSEPIMAVEVLALIALYLYCIDYRASAYTYIGQAARLAMHSGLHTRLPIGRFGVDLAQRYNCLWWSIYILDRHIASTTGCPTVVHEADITAPLPVTLESSQRYMIYSLHVKVSRLVSQVLSTLYVQDNVVNRTFLQRTRRVLKSLAGLARELEDTIHNKLQSTVQVDLASVAFLTLAYHECAILATRPILLSLLKRSLRNDRQYERLLQDVSGRVKTLVDTCANSAAKVIDLLTVRLENNMIEIFLPFQLETLSSALIVLLVIRAICPTTHNVSLLEERAHAIFDELTAQKNPIAKYRKTEATHVKELLSPLVRDALPATNEMLASVGHVAQGLPTPVSHIADELIAQDLANAQNMRELIPGQPLAGAIPAFPMEPDDDFLINFGLSSEAIDCVANQVLFDSPVDDFSYWTSGEGHNNGDDHSLA